MYITVKLHSSASNSKLNRNSFSIFEYEISGLTEQTRSPNYEGFFHADCVNYAFNTHTVQLLFEE